MYKSQRVNPESDLLRHLNRLKHKIKHVLLDDKEILYEPHTDEELIDAIQDLPNNPGPNVFSAEFSKMFLDVIKTPVYKDAFDKGIILSSLKSSNIIVFVFFKKRIQKTQYDILKCFTLSLLGSISIL